MSHHHSVCKTKNDNANLANGYRNAEFECLNVMRFQKNKIKLVLQISFYNRFKQQRHYLRYCRKKPKTLALGFLYIIRFDSYREVATLKLRTVLPLKPMLKMAS